VQFLILFISVVEVALKACTIQDTTKTGIFQVEQFYEGDQTLVVSSSRYNIK